MPETIQLQLLLATFAGWIGRSQTAVIAYLIEENRVVAQGEGSIEVSDRSKIASHDLDRSQGVMSDSADPVFRSNLVQRI